MLLAFLERSQGIDGSNRHALGRWTNPASVSRERTMAEDHLTKRLSSGLILSEQIKKPDYIARRDW